MPATVSIRNDGDTDWTWNQPNPYRLGSQDPPDNTVWSLGRVDLPTSLIHPGDTATFHFTIWAPQTPGIHSFNWQMVQEGIDWFGSKCSYNVTVVGQPTVIPTATPQPLAETQTPFPTRPQQSNTPTATPISTQRPLGIPSATLPPQIPTATTQPGVPTPVVHILSSITIENKDIDGSTGGMTKPPITTDLQKTIDNPIPWRLNDLTAAERQADQSVTRTIQITLFDGTNYVSIPASITLKRGTVFTPLSNVTHISTCQDIKKPGDYVLDNDLTTGNPGNNCLNISYVNNVNVDCNNHAITPGGILVKGSNTFSIKSCNFPQDNLQHPFITSITVLNSQHGTITLNTIEDHYLFVNYSTDIHVIQNTFNTGSIFLLSSYSSVIDGNTFKLLDVDAQTEKIAFKKLIGGAFIWTGNGSGNQIINNVMDGGSDGILSNMKGVDDGVVLGWEKVTYGENFDVVKNNTIKNVFDCGIEPVGLVSNTLIEGNRIDNAGTCGVGAWWSSSFSGNTVINNSINSAPAALVFFYDTRVPQDLQLKTVSFSYNLFKNNKFTNRKDESFIGSNTPASIIKPDSDKVKLWNRSDNVFTDNDFGVVVPPLFFPGNVFTDGGNNVCTTKGSTPDFPLHCIGGQQNSALNTQSTQFSTQDVKAGADKFIQTIVSVTKDENESQFPQFQELNLGTSSPSSIWPTLPAEIQKPPVSCNGFNGYGDVNNDGTVSQEDFSIVQKAFGKSITLTPDQQKRAHVGISGGQGELDALDLEYIALYINGSPVIFPVCSSAKSQ